MKEKILKLTNLVYKTLEFFPESDPLKNKSKEKALVLMETLIYSFDNQSSGIKKISEDIDVLIGYLQIGKSQGWMSSINFLIISEEYGKIKITLKEKEKLPKDEITEKQVSLISETKEDAPGLALSGVLNEDSKDSAKITERQKMILEFLEKNEKAQVMDLQTVFPQITKRTIRRDLDDLLLINKIVRIGDYNQVSYRLKDRTFTS